MKYPKKKTLNDEGLLNFKMRGVRGMDKDEINKDIEKMLIVKEVSGFDLENRGDPVAYPFIDERLSNPKHLLASVPTSL